MKSKVSKALGAAAVIAITFGFSASAMADPNENAQKQLGFTKVTDVCSAGLVFNGFGGWGPDFNPGDFADIYEGFFDQPGCEGVVKGSGQDNGNRSKPD